MQLRHISPRSSDWVDAMDEGGGRGWEKLGPEERTKLRVEESVSGWQRQGQEAQGEPAGESRDSHYGWDAASASR